MFQYALMVHQLRLAHNSFNKVKEVNQHTFDCFLHRKNPAGKKLSPEFNVVMKEVIRVLVVKEDTLTAEPPIKFGLILNHSIFICCTTHK
jgi:hypothetical protein